MPSPLFQPLLAFLAGPLIHWTYFIHGEKDLHAASIARLHLVLGVILVYLESQHEAATLGQAAKATAKNGALYSTGLFTSIILYRLFLSRLRNIPGPLSMRVSKLVHVWSMMDSKKQNFKELHKLNAKYGNVVRTGPSEVTLFGYDAYHQVHGTDSKCARSAYYDILHPMVSLDTTRDPITHTYRRKLWDQAFSIKALKQQEFLIYDYAQTLVKQLHKRTGTILDISLWIEYYTFDLMGSLGLTIDFNNLDTEGHPILELWHIAHKMLGPLSCAPWVKHLFMGIPFIERLRYYRQFMTWARDELNRNIQNNKEARKNIIGYVLSDAEENGGLQKNWNFVMGDFVLVIAAGSDPVRLVLSNMIYYLIHNPEQIAHIRRELDSVDLQDYNALKYSNHLSACIYETLRLHPPVPSAGLRLAPKGGLVVNETFIPEGTTLVTPQYSLHRDPACFSEPEKWIPSRWTTKPELILNKDAFVPWSIGKMSCLGKNLSLLETRVAAALILTEFDMDFAPGEDDEKVFSEATDFFTATAGPLNVVLRARMKAQ